MILRRLGRLFLYLVLLGALGVAVLGVVLYVKIEPQLPSIEVLRDVQLQEPLRVYTRDRKLIAEFGDKRRNPVTIDAVPDLMVKAFLAAEDDRFFEHGGVDVAGLVSAAIELLRTGVKRRGASTITMQVARNFFLSREKTYLRKLTEILLAMKIERSLSKEEILELYLNKIYLGHRAYGVEAAARVYYGAGIGELTTAQMAMIAALPKAPSRVNPVSNPEAAVDRRNYILGRMHSLDFIDRGTWEAAVAEEDTASLHRVKAGADAAYVAEMVRGEMVRRHGVEVYTSGYEVITTLVPRLQQAGVRALRDDLLAYTHRHGYRGPEAQLEVDLQAPDSWQALLQEYRDVGGLSPGLVVAVGDKTADIYVKNQEVVTVPWEGLSWARAYKGVNSLGRSPKLASDVVAPGDVVRVSRRDDGSWRLSQVPRVEGALVSVRPEDGAILALVGGFDFQASKFNRVTQAKRQPGSSFKPVIYSAALEKGFTPASLVNDAPVVFDDPKLESTWRPENYSGEFHGPTRLREALYRSRNLISIRILRSIGARYAAEYAERFGFEKGALPHDLTLALGSASVTPLQMARAYAVLANGGYLVEPYYISQVLDASGNIVSSASPAVVCAHCSDTMETLDGGSVALHRAEQVLSPQNAWLMTSMLQDVIRLGTGKRARELKRPDIAGKTGTTNDQMDAWFSGFNPSVVATVWVGFDQLEPLGRRETGGRAALPMWIDYMRVALDGVAVSKQDPPEGLVTVRIDPVTGMLASSTQADAIFETFREENVPQQTSRSLSTGGAGDSTTESLF